MASQLRVRLLVAVAARLDVQLTREDGEDGGKPRQNRKEPLPDVHKMFIGHVRIQDTK